MPNTAIKKVQNTIKHWYLPLISGLIFIVIGIYAFTTPVKAFGALALFFALTFVVSGLAEIFYAISNKEELDNWGWALFGGVLDLVIGLLLLSRPEVSALVLSFFVGFAIMFRSILGMAWSLEMRKYGAPDWVGLIVISILGLVFSIILIGNPGIAGLTIVIWTALAFVSIGFFQLFISFRLRKLHKLGKEVKNRFREMTA
jgi:uncharacterized membrane protein HdeD (DUF308 family)